MEEIQDPMLMSAPLEEINPAWNSKFSFFHVICCFGVININWTA